MYDMKKTLLVIGIILIVFIAIFLSSGRNSENTDSFEKAKKEFQSGNYSVIVNIPKEYYIRPEFYTNYNSNERSNSRMAIYGYGVYPSEVTYSAENISFNQSIDVYAFILTSVGVYSYQGLGLNISSPSDELFVTHVEPSDILLSPKYVGNSETFYYFLANALSTSK